MGAWIGYQELSWRWRDHVCVSMDMEIMSHCCYCRREVGVECLGSVNPNSSTPASNHSTTVERRYHPVEGGRLQPLFSYEEGLFLSQSCLPRPSGRLISFRHPSCACVPLRNNDLTRVYSSLLT